MRKRVLYVIYSSSQNAGGGHFYSLLSISKSLENDIDYRILNLGYVFASPLQKLPFVDYINITKNNFFIKIRAVLNYIKEYKPDVIHAFDPSSLIIAKTILFFYRKLLVYTQCGGADSKRNIVPDADIQILFSKENYDYYIKYGSSNTPKYLIPNRTRRIYSDFKRGKELIEKYKLDNKFIILRISRFNTYYRSTHLQSINLLKKYLQIKSNAVLIFIGKIQEEDYHQYINNYSKQLPIIIITDDKFTNNASGLIDIADVIVATGRGVMEASSLNKTIFCPVKNSDLPIVLNNETITKLFKFNFSERVEFDKNFIDEQNASVISKNMSNNSIDYFNRYFSVDNIKEKYINIYNSNISKRVQLKNYLIYLILFLK